MAGIDDQVHDICTAIRREMRIGELCRKDCCIVATAILIDVLAHFGRKARPLSVVTNVYNPKMTQRIAREGMVTLANAEEWGRNGCWCVAVGEEKPGEWCGHLVAILDECVLIDLTLDQANRPQHDIFLPTVLLTPFPPEFLTDESWGLIGNINGCRVTYEARPSDHLFERSVNWHNRRLRAAFVKASIRRIDGNRSGLVAPGV